MARIARVPAALTRGPFTLSDASRAGLHPWHLRGAEWRRVGPGIYVSRRLSDSPELRFEAATRRVPAVAAFSGFTAAWLHGLDIPPDDPIEITVPAGCGIAARSGLAVRRCMLETNEVVKVRGVLATSLLRTIRDLCGRLPLTEAVVVADMALHARLLKLADLCELVERSARAHGVAMLRRTLPHVEPLSESPMETRMRMLVVLAGLPRPAAQVPIRDRHHRFLGRPDLFYPEQRLGLEYDGGIHRIALVEDNRRQNRLLEAGVRLLRFTAADIFDTPELVVGAVRSALAGQGQVSHAKAR